MSVEQKMKRESMVSMAKKVAAAEAQVERLEGELVECRRALSAAQPSIDWQAQIMQAEGELTRYREALERVKRDEGKVCSTFETCQHPACNSSYAAWAIADEALSSSADSQEQG